MQPPREVTLEAGMARLLSTTLTKRVLALAALAVALGYVEAAVVVYLRQVIAPVRQEHFPDAVREPLPLLSREQLRQAGPHVESLLALEVVREVAAIAVLLAAAYGLRRRRGELAAFFLLGFAVWDIFYYLFLKLLVNWPASLGTWDILYLIPVPWVAPVWAPLMVSATLLVVAFILLTGRGDRRVPADRAVKAALLIAAGVAGILTSFFLRLGEAMERVPQQFDWPLFLAGWLLGVAGVVWLLSRPSPLHR